MKRVEKHKRSRCKINKIKQKPYDKDETEVVMQTKTSCTVEL